MECNVCGADAKCVRVTYRQITFITAHCECGKVRREITTTLATKEEIEKSLRHMRELNARGLSEVRVAAIEYLERLLERLLSKLVPKTTAQRRHDLWERRFLREALQEDYYA